MAPFLLFLYSCPLTNGLILTINMSCDVFPHKEVTFSGLVNIDPHLGGQIPTPTKGRE